MLMDDRGEKSNDTNNAEKSISLDRQRVFNQKPCVPTAKKRGGGGGGSGGGAGNAVKRKLEPDDQIESRKKSRKVLLSSLSSGKKSKKSAADVNGLLKPKLRKSVDSRVCVGGSGGVALSLSSSVSIPKRPRNFIRRKKVKVKVEVDVDVDVDVDVSAKEKGTLSDRGVYNEEGKANGNARSEKPENSNANGNLGRNGGNSNGSGVVSGRRKNNSHDHKKNDTYNAENSTSYLCNGSSVTRKARRNHKRNKETGAIRSPGLTAEEAKQPLDMSGRVCDESQDDEENLEANAARMLSSRFDPSCSRIPSGGKSCNVPSENGLMSSNRDLGVGRTDIRDCEARISRARNRPKSKGISRERRRFYAVVFKDLDSFWVINRRIKVFWPLDRSWYIGHIIGYDPEKNLHHVKYDDREEEWIDLQHERFKLFLFPSEIPGKGGKVRPTTHSKKEKHSVTEELVDMTNGSSMESEPIISWLARSTRHKPPIDVKKKRKLETLFESSSMSEGKNEPLKIQEVGPSGFMADDFAVLPNNSGDCLNKAKPIAENCLSNNDKAPIVYFRRRFRRKKVPPSSCFEGELCHVSEKALICQNVPDFVDSIDLDANMSLWNGEPGHLAKRSCSDESIWDTDCSGVLKLVLPITSLKVPGLDLCSPLSCVTSNIVGWQSRMFMLEYGTLISLWPMIHLEILFVDNVVGLQFLLFEGCMNQAVLFVFLVLSVFCKSECKEMHDVQELPVTSIRFRFSGLQILEKQLVFTFYNFSELAKSKWSYLDRKLKKYCILTKKLPSSDCTFENITALQNGWSQLTLTNVDLKPSSMMNLWKQSRQCATNISSSFSACGNLNQLAHDCDQKIRRLSSSAISLSPGPPIFLSLHLLRLMGRTIPFFGVRDQTNVHSTDHPENEATVLSSLSLGGNSLVLSSVNCELDSCPDVDVGAENVSVDLAEQMTTMPSSGLQDFPENDSVPHLEKGNAELSENEQRLSASQSLGADDHICKVDNTIEGGQLNGMTVDIQSSNPVAKDTDIEVQNTIDLALDTNDGVCSPNPAASQSSWGTSRHGNLCSSASANLSPGWLDRKQDLLQSGFGRGPKRRPRTQVSYFLPLGGQDCNFRNKSHHLKNFSHKRIRRASEKKTLEASGTSQRNMELVSCEANVLVTVGDRGWRELGAKIVLEVFDHNEWRLAVKISGDTRYSYKAHQFLQPGTTNRYTHAMMWKGGKDWILEFSDRSQWTIFKEMHEECYNRNFRASSVKNIPIPGVYLIEDNDDNVPEVPYLRPSPNYHRQDETDVDIAMDPFRVLYDMDSDDERWVMKHRSLEFNESGCGDVSDEMFERTIDVLEKFAYTQQRDNFSLDELQEVTSEIGSLEAIKIIYEHWREKRRKKGMPLVRHLQPPLWERYQQQLKEWEQAVEKSNLSLSGGFQEKPVNVEKPPMFAFCLKPRGLEMPNRGSKQRSQKKLPIGALSNGIPVDADAYHNLVGRRLNGVVLGDDRVFYTAYNQVTSDSSPVLQGLARVISPREYGAAGYFSLNSDGYERSHYPKLHRNKSKKLQLISSSNDQSPVTSYIHRTPVNRNSVSLWSSSEWPSQMHYNLEWFHRLNIEQLDPAEIDEFRLRDASSAARHAAIIAKMKRENAQRMLCRADLAMHKAMAAIMTAEAVKASYSDPISDVELSG